MQSAAWIQAVAAILSFCATAWLAYLTHRYVQASEGQAKIIRQDYEDRQKADKDAKRRRRAEFNIVGIHLSANLSPSWRDSSGSCNFLNKTAECWTADHEKAFERLSYDFSRIDVSNQIILVTAIRTIRMRWEQARHGDISQDDALTDIRKALPCVKDLLPRSYGLEPGEEITSTSIDERIGPLDD